MAVTGKELLAKENIDIAVTSQQTAIDLTSMMNT
jgi:hypothetical protein